MFQLPPGLGKLRLSPVYILQDPQPKRFQTYLVLPGRREEKPWGELLTENSLPQVVLQFQRVSNSFKQFHKKTFFISKNNILMGSKPYSPHPGSLADSVFIQSFKFPPQNQEPAPVPRQNPLEYPFPKGGREPGRKECQVGNTGIHLSRSPLVGQEKVGNFDFSVSSA